MPSPLKVAAESTLGAAHTNLSESIELTGKTDGAVATTSVAAVKTLPIIHYKQRLMRAQFGLRKLIKKQDIFSFRWGIHTKGEFIDRKRACLGWSKELAQVGIEAPGPK